MPYSEGEISSNFLPDIDIKMSGDLQNFLFEMSEIGRASGHFCVEEHYNALGYEGSHVVNFRYLGESYHDEVGGQLIVHRENPGRVSLEMRALRWHHEPLTYAAYCETAKSIMAPLLSAYNRKFGSRYRLRIEKLPRKGRVLTNRTEHLFRRFALLANTSSLHLLDWRRFYDFILDVRQDITEVDLREMLIKYGFPFDKAEHVAEIYLHLVEFKRYSNKRGRAYL